MKVTPLPFLGLAKAVCPNNVDALSLISNLNNDGRQDPKPTPDDNRDQIEQVWGMVNGRKEEDPDICLAA